ncbi:PREDICTED: low affinity immunoglobulin epsilon Fc receptor-like isoform X1 [Acropora digitifera]|uniref:low affinity immunoglobulin epsilon Fc receptor-like isoform X1 n=1 Tax=Acropora digitifera TaxID=70779 RepID=UPI00077A5C8C|nr:PREDICTED: low affinity immunoglobulin epsilon Fc receptor-like isoform X1 [Acropora digitifera]
MNLRLLMRKFVRIVLCCVTLLELVDRNTFGFNKGSLQQQDSKRSSSFYKVEEGKALTGHIISVHQTRNVLDCSHQCLSNPACTSFNFEIRLSQSLSTCELNNVLRTSSNNKLQSRDGFAYYEQLTPRERPKQEITPRTLTTGQVSNCGQHWRPFKSGCLRLFQDRKDWVAANQHCATLNTCNRRNGRLISIFSQDDNDQIDNSRILLACPQGEYYIGLNDLQGTGTYKWADGTNASFTNWNTSFPRGGKGVVMKMNGNSDDGKWQTKNMNSAMRFICECPDGPCASQ